MKTADKRQPFNITQLYIFIRNSSPSWGNNILPFAHNCFHRFPDARTPIDSTPVFGASSESTSFISRDFLVSASVKNLTRDGLTRS